MESLIWELSDLLTDGTTPFSANYNELSWELKNMAWEQLQVILQKRPQDILN